MHKRSCRAPGRQAKAARRGAVRRADRDLAAVIRHALPQQENERPHRQEAEDTDGDLRRAQAVVGDEILDDRRPDRAAHVVAGGTDGNGDAAPPREPVRDVGDQRRESGGRAEADENMHQRELPRVGAQRGPQIAAAEAERAEHQRPDDAEAVGHAADDDAAQRETDHGKRIGQRGIGPGDVELRLDGRQRDDDRPHADAADRADHDGGGEPEPRLRGLHGGAACAYGLCRNGHGERTIQAVRPLVKAPRALPRAGEACELRLRRGKRPDRPGVPSGQ